MLAGSRTGACAKKGRKRSAGAASRYGTRFSKEQRRRRASAPILSPQRHTFIRVPSPISRSAETVGRLGLSQTPSPQPSPSKSVSFSAEADEVFFARPESLSVPGGANLTPPPSEKALYCESHVVWAGGEEGEPGFSLLASVCEAGFELHNPCDFVSRAFFILTATWPVTVFLVALLALPLVMTIIGVNYLHECPVQPKLPIYLVVGGCFGIVKLLFLLWKQMKRHKEDLGDLHDDLDLLTMTRMTNMALNVFLVVWFGLGHYWLFGVWTPHFTAPLHEPRNWCDKTVFVFCFWQLVIGHVLLALLLLSSLALCGCFVGLRCLAARPHS